MSTDVVGSHEPTFASEAIKPSNHGYGQNAYSGASSDLHPLTNPTVSGFLSAADLAGAQRERKLMQQRPVSDKPYPTAFGMHPPKRT